MKTIEFLSYLDNANTVEDLMQLRSNTNCPRYIKMCKKKVRDLAYQEGYKIRVISTSYFKQFTPFTLAGEYFEFKVPERCRIFKGTSVNGYVLEKTNKGRSAVIVYKEN